MAITTSESNIAWELTRTAKRVPTQIAIAAPRGSFPKGRADYETLTFKELDERTDRIAAGLVQQGLKPGQRIVLLVRPGIDFIALTFALFKAAAVVVLIDPGMGREHLLNCLEAAKPDGFVAIPIGQLARSIHRKRFPSAKLNVTVGRRWLWGGTTLKKLEHSAKLPFTPPTVAIDDPAAIIFTTGSTGPPKGVEYRHGNFVTQVEQLQEFYQIEPGEIDLPGFPLFALFNSAMGVTTVIPDMDPRKPAEVDPNRIVQAIDDWQVTQAFGSPAIWNVVGQHCEKHAIKLPTIKRILSAGAPVPPHVLKRMIDAVPEDADMHTPYGATESLPVASINARRVLAETASQTAEGSGTCVGHRFSAIDWRIIRIDDGPIEHIDDSEALPQGEIGELIVSGPAVTRQYVTRTETNALAKIADENGRFWHRIGDVGYLDDQDRFWFCGRKAHRLETDSGPMYTVRCEAIVNQHPAIYRSALVGLGPLGKQQPAMVLEPWPGQLPASDAAATELLDQVFSLAQKNELTNSIPRKHFLIHSSLPVDIRHNAKIFREKLAPWAEEKIQNTKQKP